MGSAGEGNAYHHGNLRQALVAAAVEILERDGVAGLGLRAAARAAGVSQTAPYHHFGGKEGLLAAVAALGFRELKADQERIEQRSLAAGLGAEEAMLELGIGYVRMARSHPELFKLMFGQTLPDRAAYPELVEAYTGARSFIERAIRHMLVELQGEADPREVALAVAGAWSTVHGLAILLIDGRIVPGEDEMPDEEALVRTVVGRVARTVERKARADT